MATDASSEGPLVSWYRSRIGDPNTEDEARGYWLFALGVVLGAVGILLFLAGDPGSTVRQWAIVVASAGLALVFAGPILRLPLRPVATWLVGIGLLACAAAIVWFYVTYPGQWDPETGQPTVVGLYAAGLLAMALGGVFVPVLAGRGEAAARAEALEGDVDELETALVETAADEDDLARVVARLRDELDDAAADEGDLAARLRALRESQSRFELYEDRGEEWRWRLRHANGNLVASSGEGYTRKHNAQKGLQAVRRDALGATVLLVEREADLPDADETFEPVEEQTSRADFEVYADDAGEHRWRLRHENGNVIADGGEGYASRGGVEDAVEGVREYVGPADYLRPDPTAVEVYRDRAAEWRWRLVHRNGNVLADGGEGYSQRSNARRAIDRIRDGIDEMTVEVYEDAAGEFRWRLLGGNDRIMADSGEGYAARGGAEEAAENVREYLPAADVLDIGQAVFEVYEDAADEWRWRLRHRNGEILADCGGGYADRSGAWDGIESVKRNAPTADVTSN